MRLFSLLFIVVLTSVAQAAPYHEGLPLLAWVIRPAVIARAVPIIREEAANGTIKPDGADQLVPLLNAGYKVNTIQVIGDSFPVTIRLYLTKDSKTLEESMDYFAGRNSKVFEVLK